MNARLDVKTGEVICARQGCGALIAEVVESQRSGTGVVRMLRFGPGWQYHEERRAWEMSARARKAVAQWRAPRDRRRHQGEGLHVSPMAAPKPGRRHGGQHRGRWLHAFPARAACAGCVTVNTLDATALGVMTMTGAPAGGEPERE